MNKKLISLLCLLLIVSSCNTTQRSLSSRKPITRIPEKVLTESKRTQTYINKDIPETPEELRATSAVKVTPALIREYINTYKDIAMVEMQRYGIPASITLAQAILESGSGQGRLARHARNHFGIKCHYGWEGDTITHDDDAKGECFRKYEHAEASFEDHSQFLLNRTRYASLFELKAGDYKGWAYGLKKAGYATDPGYSQKLLTLISKYELHQYDTQVLGFAYKEEKSISPIPNTPPIPVGNKKENITKGNDALVGKMSSISATGTASINTAKKNTPIRKDSTQIAQKISNTQIADKKVNAIVKKDSMTVDSTRVVKPQSTNNITEEPAMDIIKMYIVKKGDTLYGIARRAGVTVEQLMNLNNMNNSNLNLGQILVIRE
ncbi:MULTISPECIES: glucosaminidase domain-containing protein [unclassified Capnocytophaga]|uniref:glucosaminidase domain-containing protein n=1 Tax=unclassified Capnocytophaga TaxID=2640652 RepID=UPI000202D161|nr:MULTISPECIES: glucosaminidase domain-containing protein [unclassified Capnocytophaga]EGD34517.1 family 4 N-acetylmuramoyl-L-alanine amidase [Capnocytophaga sp. oral taxon 338 str. F0234]MEB3005235.1 glucosaminidase domain-containing protein [Capnocytophaga sp. G2]